MRRSARRRLPPIQGMMGDADMLSPFVILVGFGPPRAWWVGLGQGSQVHACGLRRLAWCPHTRPVAYSFIAASVGAARPIEASRFPISLRPPLTQRAGVAGVSVSFFRHASIAVSAVAE